MAEFSPRPSPSRQPSAHKGRHDGSEEPRHMPAHSESEAVQDYLKEIYKLQSSEGRARTSAIAEATGVSPSSVTGMIKKLATFGLVEHMRYHGVELTPKGEQIALEIVRHHRLIEQYLAETLGLPIDQLHREADRLEHALSEELEVHIDAALGHPTHDPHGDPIPDPQLSVPSDDLRPLSSLGEGEQATVRRVPDGNDGLLRYLTEIGLVPGCRLILTTVAPYGGPLTLALGGTDRAISRELATQISVT